MVFSTGPRPEYDRKSSFYRSDFGLEQGRRLNNNDAIAYTIEEVFKLTELGCRGIVVYDIGVLTILKDLRAKKVIPSDVLFIASTHCMVTNPLIASVYANNGADQLVVLHDVGLPVLQEMRRLLPSSVLLCLPIDVYSAKGGFIHYCEIPEIVQIASPILLKLGASAQQHPYEEVNDNVVKKRIERILVGLQCLHHSNLAISEISENSKYWCVPIVSAVSSSEEIKNVTRV